MKPLVGFVLQVLFCTLAAASVTVVVEDPGGDRIAAARVALQTTVGREIETRRTSDAGEVSFEGNHAGRIVEVVADGFEPKLVLVSDDETLVVRLAIATVATTIEVEAEAEPTVAVQETAVSELAAIPSTDLIENLRATPGVNVLRRGATNIEPVRRRPARNTACHGRRRHPYLRRRPCRMDSELSHVEPGHISSVEVVTGPYALTKAAGAFGAILVSSHRFPALTAGSSGAEPAAAIAATDPAATDALACSPATTALDSACAPRAIKAMTTGPATVDRSTTSPSPVTSVITSSAASCASIRLATRRSPLAVSTTSRPASTIPAACSPPSTSFCDRSPATTTSPTRLTALPPSRATSTSTRKVTA